MKTFTHNGIDVYMHTLTVYENPKRLFVSHDLFSINNNYRIMRSHLNLIGFLTTVVHGD